jgi:hypothetical protein
VRGEVGMVFVEAVEDGVAGMAETVVPETIDGFIR